MRGMQEKYKRLLTLKRAALVDEIDSESGLVNFLESKNIFTKRQAVSASKIQDPFKKTEFILDALYRRPDEDFFKFCEALIETNQSHVVINHLTLCNGSTPPSLPASKTNGRLTTIGIEMRENESVLKLVETLKKESLHLENREHDRVQQRAQPDGESQMPSNAPQLINVDEIKVKRCEYDFYNSKKQCSYPLSRKRRGKCLIINICQTVGQERRLGAEIDERILEKLFHELHFEVNVFQDLTVEEIQNVLTKAVSDPGISGDQAFVLFVMSHGAIQVYDGNQTEVIFGKDGKPIATSQLLEPIAECQELAGKPKLAFFQACRGDNYDETDSAAEITYARETEDDRTYTDAFPPGAASLKDFIVGFPTQSGFRSFRNTRNGSWYINAIVRVFMEDAHHMDVTAMLRKVNGIVSRWLPRTDDPRMLQKCQIASISDNLTKSYLYLFPGITEEKS